MNSRQARQYQERLTVISDEAENDTFLVCAIIEEGEDVQGMFLGRIKEDNPSLATLILHATLKNMFSMLARYNGLGPHAAAGALKGLVDVILDEILHDMYSNTNSGQTSPEA